MAPDTLDLVVALGAVVDRGDAVARVAQRLGIDDLLLFVRDPELGILVPAPGVRQTLHGGERWRSFLASCLHPGRHAAEVDLPPESLRPALALGTEDVACILLGGEPIVDEVAVLERLLPMLSAVLMADQQAALAHAAAADARDAASRAHALASALEAARAEAAELNAELREEHRRKDDFLAMLAHELRNPLAPLVTTIELLRRGPDDGASVVRHLDVMTRQVDQLSRLVEDLLDVSRVSRGRIELRRERLAVAEVLRHAVDSSSHLIAARRHRLDLHLDDEHLLVDGDRVRLTQIFANLLHNAAKYTDPGGRLTLTLAEDDGHAEVRLRDTGVGIAPEMLPRVFDLFAQAPVALGRAQGGLGIGLTLVRALVELHGGRITAQSPGPDQGSTFVVCLPLAAVPAGSPVDERVASVDGTGASRVLVVDDNRDAADSLAEVLRLGGHRAEVAYSGLVALQMASDLDPDVVLLDIGLPGIDGYEVARRLRRTVGPDTRIVAVTGYGSEKDRRLAREAGFDEHVVKPVDPAALAALLGRAPPRTAR